MDTKRQRKPLGENLLEEGVITQKQYDQAKAEEKRTGHRMRSVLVEMGAISEEDLVSFISGRMGVPTIELSNYLIYPDLIALVPEALARKHELIPVLKIGNRLTCAMADPWNIVAIDEVGAKTGLVIEPAVATETDIRRALEEYYTTQGSLEDVIKSIDIEEATVKEEKEETFQDLMAIAEEPTVIKLVNLIIVKAVEERASDIHIEPEKDVLKARFRIDGMLREVTAPPKNLQAAVTSRIKIMANMDIAKRRVPQDGRFYVKVGDREVDVRVSLVPTIYGENIVMRVLDVTSTLFDLAQLGFPAEMRKKFEKLIFQPHGVILVTGPTGSGKTTTLYAALDRINSVEKNIITIEDPVEYRLTGIRQIQVNPKVNLMFATGLRSILRQDPDVIMVGEIRDTETAEIAIHAALTGHLVFSTLHTNDASSAMTRLADMGVEPFLISSSVIGVLAQRLLRMICSECKEKYKPSKEALESLGMSAEDGPFYKGRGCPKCQDVGYKGRVGIFELVVVTEEMRKMVLTKTSAEDLKKIAVASGMVTLKEEGIKRAKEGVTTVDEVLRVTQEEF